MIRGYQPLSDVANMPTRSEILASSSASSSSDFALKTYMAPYQHQPSRRSVPRPLRAQQSFVRSDAVPFPTIREEDEDNTTTPPPSPTSPFLHDPKVEEMRVRDWAEEISRRQQNIKELRDKKIRLEQTHSLRTRKLSNNSHFNNNDNNNNNGGRLKRPSYTYLTSPERKLTPEDVEFIAALHASVVWRLWHASLSPEVFASERLLSTRLHLVLMRHGRQNIPVPPIVALNSASTFATRHMMDKDRPGIQTLPQLVAKSLLRQRKGGRPARAPRSMVGGEKERQGQQSPSSPLAKGHLSDAL